MWSSDWKYWHAFECLLKILKDFQGAETGQNQWWAVCSKAEELSVWCEGLAVVQGEPVLAGVPGWGDPMSARGCWVSLPMWAAQTACTESCSQPSRSGAVAAELSVWVQCSMPWHCWKGGRKGAAGSNLCCHSVSGADAAGWFRCLKVSYSELTANFIWSPAFLLNWLCKELKGLRFWCS